MEDRVGYACAGPKVQLEDGRIERMPCGKDVSDLVYAVPQDGKEYIIKCPNCGNEATIRRT